MANDHLHDDMPKDHNGSPTGAHSPSDIHKGPGSYEAHQDSIKSKVDSTAKSTGLNYDKSTMQKEYKKAGA